MSKTNLNVEGMSCPSCIRHVKEALTIQGVASVDVKLDEGAVTIEHDASVSTRRLIAALKTAGYDATATSPSVDAVDAPASGSRL